MGYPTHTPARADAPLPARWWLALLAALLLARIAAMIWVPLIDTSEPRYAEIARLMAQRGDWITPWFEPGVPFWGKPPLSFWLQALSIQAFGETAFSLRLPALAAHLGMLVLLHAVARTRHGQRVAQIATLVFGSMLLPFIASGAVLTDAFLSLGVTWSLAAWLMVGSHRAWYWRYGLFLGMAFGALAKGPVALVLIAGPLLAALALDRRARAQWRSLPWLPGLLLFAVLVLPWYVLAERKTPGFAHYFLLGEHVLRFIQPGWEGDRYGSAHERAYGSIWADMLLAALPWSLVLLTNLRQAFVARREAWRWLRTPGTACLLAWALVCPALFTVSGNILWTYVLPSLPAFALLTASVIATWKTPRAGALFVTLCLVVPTLTLGLTAFATARPERLKTEQTLIQTARNALASDGPIVYVDHLPFSARYYSQGQAQRASRHEILALLDDARVAVAIVVDTGEVQALQQETGQRAMVLGHNRQHTLLLYHPP